MPGPAGDVGGVGGDQDRQLDLDRIGVLELVEQQVRVAQVQIASGLGIGAQQVTGQHEEVVELETPVAAPRPSGLDDLGGHQGCESHQYRVSDRFEHIGHRVIDGADVRPDLGGRHRPGRLAAEAGATPPLGAMASREEAELALGVFHDGDSPHLGQHLPQVVEQLVARVLALRDPLLEPVDGGLERREVHRWKRSVRDRDQIVEAIPVLVELDRHVTQRRVVRVPRFERYVQRRRSHQQLLVFGVVVQPVDEPLPTRLVFQLRRDLVEDPHSRWETRGDRELAEDAIGESMHRRDGGQVGLVDRLLAPIGSIAIPGFVSFVLLLFEQGADA